MSDSQNIPAPKDEAKAAPRLGWRPQPLARALFVRAVLWSLAFGAAHLLGFRTYTSLLSGTSPYGTTQQVLGVVYILFYIGLVFLVPVLILAAVLIEGAAFVTGIRMRNISKGSPDTRG